MTVTGDAPSNLSVRQAAFIGVGAMVGAGIFALLGAAGEVAGAAVWVSFLLAGAIAALQGYSFAKFGARYPTGAVSWSTSSAPSATVTSLESSAGCCSPTNAIITAMVAVSFGSYADSAFADGDGDWTAAFAVLVVVVMSALNILGSESVARAQTVVVIVVIGILTVFAVATLTNLTPICSRSPAIRPSVTSSPASP